MLSYNNFKHPSPVFVKSTIGLLLSLLLYLNGQFAVAQPAIKIAVAANFQPTLQRLAKLYSDQTKQRIVISSASSGKHFAQINHGAGFDLFLSADVKRAKLLEQQNNIPIIARTTYAYGQLAWACNKPCSEYAIKSDGLPSAALFSQWNIAQANAKLSPYGSASEHYLTAQSLRPRKKVRAENIRQTFQFLLSGNVELALVAKSNAIAFYADRPGNFQAIDPGEYPAIEQQMVLINNQARGFFNFVLSATARDIIQQDGYLIPTTSHSGH